MNGQNDGCEFFQSVGERLDRDQERIIRKFATTTDDAVAVITGKNIHCDQLQNKISELESKLKKYEIIFAGMTIGMFFVVIGLLVAVIK